MGLLQSLRGSREFSGPTPAATDIGQPSAQQADPFSTSLAIGGRQERLAADLNTIGEMVGHLRQLGPMVEELQQPLLAEFESYRRDHAELLGVKAHNEALTASVRSLRDSEHSAKRKISESTKANEDLRGQLDDMRKSLSNIVEEGAQHKDHLTTLRSAHADLKTVLVDGGEQLRRSEEDATALRNRLAQAAERRREMDTLAAQARQDADLAEAENASLRHRLDELAGQLANVSRSEAQAQIEIVAERERAAVVLAETERGLREVTRQAEAFEIQLVASKAQAASLYTRVEASGARNTKLERLCTDLSGKITEGESYRQSMEGLTGDGKVALERAAERIEQLERLIIEQKSAHSSLDRARLTALERGDQLAAALQAHETALSRAEERVQLLNETLQVMASDEHHMRQNHEDETARLTGEVRRLETEHHLTQAALKASREHRSFTPAA